MWGCCLVSCLCHLCSYSCPFNSPTTFPKSNIRGKISVQKYMPWSKPSTFHTISFGTRRPIQIEFLLQAAVPLFQPSYVLLQTSYFNVANGFPLLCTRCINKGLFAQNEADLSSLIRLFGSGSADNYRVVFPPLCIFNMLQIPYACGISCLFAWVSSEVNFSKEQCEKERKAANFPDTEEQRMCAAGRIQLLRNILDTIKLKA